MGVDTPCPSSLPTVGWWELGEDGVAFADSSVRGEIIDTSIKLYRPYI